VPIVMAGGKKLAELDALTMAYNAVVHKNAKPKEAYDMFSVLKAKG
jgi:hypothetical protein